MSRVEADHLAREAIVYVRQSTIDQVNNNVESRRRQYGLVERARQLGWANVSVIDDDLGRSGSGVSRPGFEKLLAAICDGRVGAVVSIEASRLARNGRDWHTLLEFCGLVGTLIADEDGVYDPRLPNDRLLLGMKGTMSEMELTILRQRAHEALKQKARRGELFTSVAIGYVRSKSDRIEKDPDLRVREALALVFRKFAEMQSVRQVHLWFRQESIALPAVDHGPEGRHLQWKAPVYNTILHILTNPIYAGAYAYGRSMSKTRIENGRKRVMRGLPVEQSEWDVLIRDHHQGYIGWDAFEKESAPDQGQRKRQELCEPGRCAAGRSLARRLVPLRPLRSEAACRLRRNEGRCRALSLPRRFHQPRDRALHWLRQSSRRRRSRRRGRGAHSASRRRSGPGGSSGARTRRRREASTGRAGARAGAFRGCARSTAI